jgi:hypothetical protein
MGHRREVPAPSFAPSKDTKSDPDGPDSILYLDDYRPFEPTTEEQILIDQLAILKGDVLRADDLIFAFRQLLGAAQCIVEESLWVCNGTETCLHRTTPAMPAIKTLRLLEDVTNMAFREFSQYEATREG